MDFSLIPPYPKNGSNSQAEMRAIRAEESLAFSFPTSPNLDGYVLPADMLTVLKSGQQNDVPVLTGMVEGDAMLFSRMSGSQTVTLERYRESAREKYRKVADQYLALYPADTDAEAVAQSGDLFYSINSKGKGGFWKTFYNAKFDLK